MSDPVRGWPSARLSRRALLGAGSTGVLLAVAGCGAVPATPGPFSPAKPVTDQAAGGSAGPTGAGRVVRHAMGETVVPTTPSRVVVLDTGELDNTLALGMTPIGAVSWFQEGSFQAYLAVQTAGIVKVGTVDQPNLETMVALQPDLILSSKLRHESIYPTLAQIAPTVFTARVGATWKENLALHAEALGKREHGGQLLAAYHQRLAHFRASMGERRAVTRVSVVRSFPDHIRLYLAGSFIGTVLADAGLPQLPSQADEDMTFARMTREQLPGLDADVIFVMHTRPERGSQLRELLADPLWSGLPAVRAGRVYEVPDDTWALGIGILAANQVVDDLFTYLVHGAS